MAERKSSPPPRRSGARSGRRRRPSVEDELEAVRACAREPHAEGAQERIAAWLKSDQCLVVARVARLIREAMLDGHEAAMIRAFERFMVRALERDPGCTAKLELVAALDHAGTLDPDPFLAAARHVQPEPSWGPPIDSAGPLRAAAVRALANQGYMDLPLIAAELLADPEPPARLAASEALAHSQNRAAGALLILKHQMGDEDPVVHAAAMTGLLRLLPEWALERLADQLEDPDPQRRELAALSLGESGRDDALDILVTALDQAALPADREPLIRAVGHHRSDRAVEILIEQVADGATRDAAAALVALSPRRHDTRIRERIEAALESADDASRWRAFRDAGF